MTKLPSKYAVGLKWLLRLLHWHCGWEYGLGVRVCDSGSGSQGVWDSGSGSQGLGVRGLGPRVLYSGSGTQGSGSQGLVLSWSGSHLPGAFLGFCLYLLGLCKWPKVSGRATSAK